jgi:hypothetical protein
MKSWVSTGSSLTVLIGFDFRASLPKTGLTFEDLKDPFLLRTVAMRSR